jgi:hypothetical protein
MFATFGRGVVDTTLYDGIEAVHSPRVHFGAAPGAEEMIVELLKELEYLGCK